MTGETHPPRCVGWNTTERRGDPITSRVVWYRNSWWIRTRWGGNKKRDRRIGVTREHKREAEEIARKLNAALALGTFAPDRDELKPLACDDELFRWHEAHRVTMSHSYEVNTRSHIDNHLIRYFGSKDLRTLTEEDLLDSSSGRWTMASHPRRWASCSLCSAAY